MAPFISSAEVVKKARNWIANPNWRMPPNLTHLEQLKIVRKKSELEQANRAARAVSRLTRANSRPRNASRARSTSRNRSRRTPQLGGQTKKNHGPH